MLDDAQDAVGVALRKGMGVNRFGVTPSLLYTITGPALGLLLQRSTSTRGGDVFAGYKRIARRGKVSQGSDRVEHAAPPKRKALYRVA